MSEEVKDKDPQLKEFDDDHASVSGEPVARDKFAYVGDPKDKSTWKLPIHDESHVRNALARFGSTELPADKKTEVAHKLVHAAKEHGIDTSGFEKEHLTEAKDDKAGLSEIRDGMIRIPVAYTGSFEKVEDGKLKKFNITGNDLRSMAQRLSKRETPIDYGHNSAHTVPPGWDKAAGWFAPKMGEVEPFGLDPDTQKPREILYAWAELTPACLHMVANKEYRYFSPEPHWNDKDEHGKPIGTHMAAGAITNRPFLKDLPPIEIDPADYPQLLQMAALSESEHLMTMTPSTAHVDTTVNAKKEPTMKKLKLKKLADGENKGQTGCFDESGEMVGLAEKEGGMPKFKLKLNKDGEHKGKVGCFEGDDMVGLADHRSLKSAHKALVEYDPAEGEDDPEDAEKKREAQMREQQDRSNMACLTELADCKAGEVIAMSEGMAESGRLTLPGLVRVQKINRLIDDSTRSGKILPKQRRSFFILATANYEAAEAFLKEMVTRQVDTTVRGFQGSNEVADPEKEMEARISALMTEKKMRYADAYAEVMRLDPYLKAQLDKQKAKQLAEVAQ